MAAGRNDMNANLLFTWLRRHGKRAAGAGSGGLMLVVVEPAGTAATPTDAATDAGQAVGRIEM